MAPQTQGILVLRKACKNCTRAKRRCVVRLPKCERCCTKKLACNYDLQPLVGGGASEVAAAAAGAATPADHQSMAAPQRTLSGQKVQVAAAATCQGSFCWFDLAERPSYLDKVVLMRMDHGLVRQTPTHPAMQISVDAETAAYTLEQLRLVPQLARAGQMTAFIHPKLRMRKVLNHVDVILTDRRDGAGMMGTRFRDLVKTDIAKEDLEGTLAAVQSLMLYLTIALNDPDQTHRAWGEGLMPLLKAWIEVLLVTAQQKMPRGLTPWQSWLLAESVRRTIIIGYVTGCAYQHVRLGYVWHKLFVESLPFDARPGLWSAQSPQAWSSVAGEKVCSKVGEQLTSFHDFSVSYPHVSWDALRDPFTRLILVVHYGKQRIVDGIA